MKNIYKKIYDNAPIAIQNCLINQYGKNLERERYKGNFIYFRDFLIKSQWLSIQELEEYQNAQLIKFVKHAYETVPYYRHVFNKRKIKPLDIKTKDDLWKLPLLKREDIKINFKSLISKVFKAKSLKRGYTSGTTGSPLKICYDPQSININYAALDRQYNWAGSRIGRDGDRIVVLKGSVIVPRKQKKPPYWRYNPVHNQIFLSSFHMRKENLHLYIEEMKKFHTSVIDGYPSTLYILAKFLLNIGEKFPLKAAITSSETLYDYQREIIKDRFDCEVFDYYTSAERVIFASECEKHQGKHINMEYGIHEILDEYNSQTKPGTFGKLVGTSINNLGMPLIRYVTNDMTSTLRNSCSCKRELVMIEDISTKAEDILILKDDTAISPSLLTHPFKTLKGIEKSQIIQKDYDRLIVKIVPGKGYTNSVSNNLIKGLLERIGKEMSITIQIVDDIPQCSSGKFRWVVTEVTSGI